MTNTNDVAGLPLENRLGNGGNAAVATPQPTLECPDCDPGCECDHTDCKVGAA